MIVREVADKLGVSIARVHQFIDNGRLKAKKYGTIFLIESADLEALEIKKTGRPRNSATKLGRPRKLASKKKAK